jgi:hypothetical protein
MRLPPKGDEASDDLLQESIAAIGAKWKEIAKRLDGFPECECSNRWFVLSNSGRLRRGAHDEENVCVRPIALLRGAKKSEAPFRVRPARASESGCESIEGGTVRGRFSIQKYSIVLLISWNQFSFLSLLLFGRFSPTYRLMFLPFSSVLWIYPAGQRHGRFRG